MNGWQTLGQSRIKFCARMRQREKVKLNFLKFTKSFWICLSFPKTRCHQLGLHTGTGKSDLWLSNVKIPTSLVISGRYSFFQACARLNSKLHDFSVDVDLLFVLRLSTTTSHSGTYLCSYLLKVLNILLFIAYVGTTKKLFKLLNQLNLLVIQNFRDSYPTSRISISSS